jgi:hypothetical protein
MPHAGFSRCHAGGGLASGIAKGDGFIPGFHESAIYLMDSVCGMDHEPIDRGSRSRLNPSPAKFILLVHGSISTVFATRNTNSWRPPRTSARASFGGVCRAWPQGGRQQPQSRLISGVLRCALISASKAATTAEQILAGRSQGLALNGAVVIRRPSHLEHLATLWFGRCSFAHRISAAAREEKTAQSAVSSQQFEETIIAILSRHICTPAVRPRPPSSDSLQPYIRSDGRPAPNQAAR